VESRETTKEGPNRGAVGEARTKAITAASTERRQLQLSEESEHEGLVDLINVSMDHAVTSSQVRERTASREDEVRGRRSLHERIQHGDYRSQSATDHVVRRERTASRGRESPTVSGMRSDQNDIDQH
jgi:hypothetical protein